MDRENIFKQYRLIYESSESPDRQIYAVYCAALDVNVFAGSVLGTSNYAPEISMHDIVEAHIRKLKGIDKDEFRITSLNDKTYIVNLNEFDYLFVSQDFNDIIKSISYNLLTGDYSDNIDIDDAVRLGQADVDFDMFEMNPNFKRECINILSDALTTVRNNHKDTTKIFKAPHEALIFPPAKACLFAYYYQDNKTKKFKSNTKKVLIEKKPIYWPIPPIKAVESLGLVDHKDITDIQTRSGYLPED